MFLIVEEKPKKKILLLFQCEFAITLECIDSDLRPNGIQDVLNSILIFIFVVPNTIIVCNNKIIMIIMNSLFFCVYVLLTLYTGSYIANKKYVEIMQIETKKQKKKNSKSWKIRSRNNIFCSTLKLNVQVELFVLYDIHPDVRNGLEYLFVCFLLVFCFFFICSIFK